MLKTEYIQAKATVLDKKLLERLSNMRGVTQSAILVMAIRDLAMEAGIFDEEYQAILDSEKETA